MSIHNTPQPHYFPLFLGEWRSAIYDGVCFAIMFNEPLSLPQGEKIRSNLPVLFQEGVFIVQGRMLFLEPDNSFVSMQKLYYQQMLGKNREGKSAGLEKQSFDMETLEWLEELNDQHPIKYVIRDETDHGKYLYPGGDWCLVSDEVLIRHNESVEKNQGLIEEIANEIKLTDLGEEEAKLFSYSLKSLAKAMEIDLGQYPELEAFVCGPEYLQMLFHAGETEEFSAILHKCSQGTFQDITILSDLEEILQLAFQNPQTINAEQIFALSKILNSVPEGFKISLGNSYNLAMLSALAAEHKNNEQLNIISNHIQAASQTWKVAYAESIGTRAEWMVSKEMYKEALLLFELVISIPVEIKDANDFLSVYANALWLLTKHRADIKTDIPTIQKFLDQCLTFASQCPAIHTNAGLLHIQLGEFHKAVKAYRLAFTTPQPGWPTKRVKIDPAHYANALWVLIESNSKKTFDDETILFFLEHCLMHAEENPAVYTNAVYLYVQLKDLESAYVLFENARNSDHENFDLLFKEINNETFMKPFKKYLKERTS